MTADPSVQATFREKSPVFLAIGGFLALAAAMGIGRFAYTPILPFMIEDLGLSARDAGYIASANYISYLLGAVVASLRSLPGGQRLWFLGGLLASAITSAAMATGQTIVAFAALRFLSGFASAFVLVFASALVLQRLSAAGRTSLASLHYAGVGGGIVMSAIIVMACVAVDIDWKGQWIAMGLASFVAFLGALLLVPPAKATASGQEQDPAEFPDGLSLLIISYGLMGFGYVITATFLSAIVRLEPTVQHLEGVTWMVVGVSAALSIAFWSAVGRRTSVKIAYIVAALVEALAVGFSIFAANAVFLILAATGLGMGFVAITAMGFTLVRDAHPNAAPNAIRQAMGVMTVSFGIGQAVGPYLAGVMVETTGSFTAPSLLASVALVIGAGLAILWRPQAIESSKAP